MKFLASDPNFSFTRLQAQIVEDDDAFTVRVRMHNHLKQESQVWGEEIAATFEVANSMITSLANQFSIPQQCVSIRILMRRFRDGTIH